jgi:predicted porin
MLFLFVTPFCSEGKAAKGGTTLTSLKEKMTFKKLIPAAALLALAGAAQAEVTPYGLLDAAFSKGLQRKPDLISGGNSTTKLGLKGNQGLSSGLKATYQFEAGFTPELQKQGTVFDRQAWAGLSGGFGEVRLGKQDSVRFQTLVGFDLNGAANVASAQGAVSLGVLAGRGQRSIQYIAPAVSGFVVQVGHQLEYQGAKATNSVGVTYTLDKLTLAASAESKLTDGGKSSSALGASYDFGVAKVAGSYSPSKEAGKGYMLGVVAPVAGFNIGTQFAKNTVTNVTATEVFVNKEIMKGTFAYADFLSKKGAASDAYAIGVIYTF